MRRAAEGRPGRVQRVASARARARAALGTTTYGKPDRIVSPLQIMIDGPIGAAAFNNEFGRPAICGYFRTLEQLDRRPRAGLPQADHGRRRTGQHSRARTSRKRDIPAGSLLVVLGGPAMLIGLGGGAASSMTSGASDAELDFASVQRDNAEMEHRCQEVIDRCWQLGARNPIRFIHDVGAGGLSNALPELVKDGGRGGTHRPAAHSERGRGAVAARDLVQRGAGAVRAGDRAGRPRRCSQAICARERCPFAVVGEALADPDLHVDDRQLGGTPVDLPLSVLFGKPPQNAPRVRSRRRRRARRWRSAGVTIAEAADARVAHAGRGGQGVSRHHRRPQRDRAGPSRPDGRSVAGARRRRRRHARPATTPTRARRWRWASARRSRWSTRPRPAAWRSAEAITNIASARIETAQRRQAVGQLDGRGRSVRARIRRSSIPFAPSRMDLCPALGIVIPVGKDSMSMHTRWIATAARAVRHGAAVADRLGVRAGARRASRR